MSALTLLSQSNLSAVLNKIPGKKQLILESALMKPLDRVAKMSVLTKAGVEKVFKFERKPAPDLPATQTRTYLVSANLIQAKFVADQISDSLTTNTGKIHVILMPRKLLSIEKLFEEEGLAGVVELHQFSWEFIPLDYDLLSLEFPSYFRSQYIAGDQSELPAVARALWGLKSLFGNIPNVFAQGRSVKKLLKLENMFTNHYGQVHSKSSEIGHLFIFERDLDWTSCLLSPLTYEGLLDETFGISCGTVEFGPEVTKSETTTKLQLSCMDKMFDKIRNKHFATIFSVLGVTAKQLSAAQAAATSMNVTQMKQFVANDLKVMKTQSRAVALHISASEEIQKQKGSYFETQLPTEHTLVSGINQRDNMSYIEDCMAQLRPMSIPLRLICLLSHCSDGVSFSDYQKLKTQFVQAYGFQHIITWNNLVKVGIIRVKGGLSQSSSLTNLKGETNSTGGKLGIVSQHVAGLVGAGKTGNFQQIVKKLNLIPPETSLTEPTSPGYVFNGAYTPLCCKLVEEILKTGGVPLPTSPAGEALKLLPGETHFEFGGDTGNKVALILFVGGYTLAEVAAFRWLQTVTGYQFVVAGTNISSGSRLVSDAEKL